MPTIPDKIKLAMRLMYDSQLDQAENLCHQVLDSDGNHPDALHVMGLISHQMGKSDDAVKRCA